ncbi:hypothetical protein [Stenotrophomonas nitritireducens]|uniref:Uncharacterized protein n=1 Tax=Stenotrophomonas nitritireducens TaxID=83617 RepID=A0ABR5NLJ5_9GAMM|nr:hypothetical protein [Stenotrophomonas nitritireducens]KRG58756.1 hypothetical protein ABB22_06125 [Stenotrophomonas nitritireducens]
MENTPATGMAPEQFVRGYMEVDYRSRYAGVLHLHPTPSEAIAELCLFRFWLACRAYAHSGAMPAPTPPLCLPPGWTPPRQASGLDIDRALDTWHGHLLESRFDLYDRFFQLGRTHDDPLGLDAVALALSCQLFVQPSALTRAWLHDEVHTLFSALLDAFATAPGAPQPRGGGA